MKHSTISTSARHELATSSPYLLRAGLTVASFSSPIFTIHIAYPIPSKNRLFLSQIFQVETLPLSVLSTILFTCFYFYSSCIRSYGGCKMVSFYEWSFKDFLLDETSNSIQDCLLRMKHLSCFKPQSHETEAPENERKDVTP